MLSDVARSLDRWAARDAEGGRECEVRLGRSDGDSQSNWVGKWVGDYSGFSKYRYAQQWHQCSRLDRLVDTQAVPVDQGMDSILKSRRSRQKPQKQACGTKSAQNTFP